METTLLQRRVPAEIRGQVFGARHSLAAPLGAAFGGVLLQYLSAPLVIAISGLACILAGLGGLVSQSLRQLNEEAPRRFGRHGGFFSEYPCSSAFICGEERILKRVLSIPQSLLELH